MKFSLVVNISNLSISCLAVILLFGCQNSNAQNRDAIYKWSWQEDGLKLGLGVVSVGAGFYLKFKAPHATYSDLLTLDSKSIWRIDRGAISNYSNTARQMSDVFLISGIALPVIIQFNAGAKTQNGATVGMAIETFLITQGFTSIIKSTTRRYRPFTYNLNVPEDQRLTTTSRESFISGHVSTVAASSFFTAKVLTDLYPDSKLRSLIWTIAAVMPAVTGYLRYEAGRHFPTDILGGYALGALTGVLIPIMHRRRSSERVIFKVVSLSNGLMASLRIPLY